MAKRSLKASQDGIVRAKRAFDLRGWTQEYLAAEVGLNTRQSVWKFFSGRPVERHIFIDICFTLDLDWEEVVDRSAYLTDVSEPGSTTGEQTEKTASETPGDHGPALRSHLLAMAQTQCSLLELPLDLHQPMQLPQIYTDAYLRPYQRLGLPSHASKLLATTAVQPHSRVLVLGGPGAGKTTLLQHLALELVAERLRINDQPYLPVFLRLRQLALVPEANLNLQQYLNQRWSASGLTQPQIDHLWQQEQLWLLLDGWDELPQHHHQRVTQQIQTLLDTHPGLRVLVSGRSGGPGPQLNGLVTLELAEFAPQQIETFVYKWFAANHPDQGASQAQHCLEALHHPTNERLREMALTPILLHLMCLVFHSSGRFPDQRSKLYQQALDLLLGQWDQQRGIRRSHPLQQLSPVDVLGILGEVAARSFEQGKVVLEEAELLGLIAKGLAHRDPQETPPEQRWADSRAILQILIEHYGMLTERELGSYVFAHLSFQEYLTARRWALSALGQRQAQAWSTLSTHLPDPRWREVLLLTVEMVPQAEALWQALHQESQRFVEAHPELQPMLHWAQGQAEQAAATYHPAALRGFYMGLWLNQGLDLAMALDARLAIDLPPDLSFDLTLARLLHQGRQWLHDPSLQGGFDLVFAMDLKQRFDLPGEIAEALEQLQALLLDALETETGLMTWAEHQGTLWWRSLRQTLATYRHWDLSSMGLAPCSALDVFYQMQRLLVDCLHHNRCFPATTVQQFTDSLLAQEVRYEPA